MRCETLFEENEQFLPKTEMISKGSEQAVLRSEITF